MNSQTNSELDGLDSTEGTQSSENTDTEQQTTGDNTETNQSTENENITAGDATPSTNEQPTREEIGDDSQNVSEQSSNSGVAFGAVGLISAIFSVIVVVLTLISLWKIFEKAGEKGFKVLIPIYNLFILFKIAFGKNDILNASGNNDSFNFGDANGMNSFNNDGYVMDNSNNGFGMGGHLNSEFNNMGQQNMNQMNPGFESNQSMNQMNSGFEPSQNMNQMNQIFNKSMEQNNQGFIPASNNENMNNNPQNMMGPRDNNFGVQNEVNDGSVSNNDQPYNNGPIPINGSQNMTKQCPNCHAPVPLNLVICPNCGANINR